MSDTSMMSSVTQPPKQSRTLTIVLVVGLSLATIAAVFFGVRTNALQDKNAQLQSQLEQAKNENTRLQAQSQQAQSELEQAKSDIAQLQPLATKARQMPVSVSFRKALMGAGKVLIIHSTSTKNLSVDVKFTDPTSNKSKAYRVVLDGLATKEIGSMEGWAVATGDKIEVENVDYDPIIKTAP